MRRILSVLSLLAVVTASSASLALADASQDSVPNGTDVSSSSAQQPGARFNHNPGKKAAAMAVVLGLTDAQQSRIKAILDNARQANALLRQKLATDRDKIKELSNATPFDEAALRTILASDESVRSELTISRINVKNQIQAILTPDQQAKSKQLHLFASNKRHNWDNGGL